MITRRDHAISPNAAGQPYQLGLSVNKLQGTACEEKRKMQRQKQSNPATKEDDQPQPYCKMGEGRNAAVRYRLGDVRKHLASRRVINTHGGRVCSFSSFADFMSRARIEDAWLFAMPEKSHCPMDVFDALKNSVDFDETFWLT